jgi:chemotaxis protein MotB
MLRLFSDKFGVDKDRMAIVGYGETLALHSNDTEEGRAANRRVDIVVLSEYGMSAEPVTASDQSNAGSGNPDVKQASKQRRKD